jgi:hypothetical protein
MVSELEARGNELRINIVHMLISGELCRPWELSCQGRLASRLRLRLQHTLLLVGINDSTKRVGIPRLGTHWNRRVDGTSMATVVEICDVRNGPSKRRAA